eukprot:TRINITY_DN112351_c0_g1_i1.p1 TRINITY_DN112351_c0_g1~~TRINITY_DN112351_c0_g1_i1.p1  ORF type:complete len:505 (+),score=96.21 TRINITY_DN112351_c0_g1_i1:87-1601(+)
MERGRAGSTVSSRRLSSSTNVDPCTPWNGGRPPQDADRVLSSAEDDTKRLRSVYDNLLGLAAAGVSTGTLSPEELHEGLDHIGFAPKSKEELAVFARVVDLAHAGRQPAFAEFLQLCNNISRTPAGQAVAGSLPSAPVSQSRSRRGSAGSSGHTGQAQAARSKVRGSILAGPSEDLQQAGLSATSSSQQQAPQSSSSGGHAGRPDRSSTERPLPTQGTSPALSTGLRYTKIESDHSDAEPPLGEMRMPTNAAHRLPSRDKASEQPRSKAAAQTALLSDSSRSPERQVAPGRSPALPGDLNGLVGEALDQVQRLRGWLTDDRARGICSRIEAALAGASEQSSTLEGRLTKAEDSIARGRDFAQRGWARLEEVVSEGEKAASEVARLKEELARTQRELAAVKESSAASQADVQQTSIPSANFAATIVQRNWIAYRHAGRRPLERCFLALRVAVMQRKQEQHREHLTQQLAEAHLAVSLSRRLRRAQGGYVSSELDALDEVNANAWR